MNKLKKFERKRYSLVPFICSILCNRLWNFLEKISNNVPISIYIIYRNGKPSVEHYEQIYQIKIYNLLNGNKTKVSATKPLLIDVNDKKYFKSLKFLDRHKSKKHVCCIRCTWYVWRRKRISTELLIIIHKHCCSYDDNCSYIHPLKPNETNALGGISNLTLQISNALSNVLANVFPTVDNILSSDDVCDKVKSE